MTSRCELKSDTFLPLAPLPLMNRLSNRYQHVGAVDASSSTYMKNNIHSSHQWDWGLVGLIIQAKLHTI